MESRRRKPSRPTGQTLCRSPNTASTSPYTKAPKSCCPRPSNPDRPYISGVMHDSAHPDHIPADWNTRERHPYLGEQQTQDGRPKRSGAHQTRHRLPKIPTQPRPHRRLKSGNVEKTAKASNSEPTAGVPYGRVKAYSLAHKTKMPTAKCWIWTMPSRRLNRHSPRQSLNKPPNRQQPPPMKEPKGRLKDASKDLKESRFDPNRPAGNRYRNPAKPTAHRQ